METPSPHTLIFFLFFFFIHANSQSLQDKELAVLLNLKSYWQSPKLSHWINSSSNSASSHCNWPEINCTGNSVTGVTLENVDLERAVPPFICDLSNLTYLNLTNNSLPGSFPSYLYNCSKLESLDLSMNYYVGKIPDDIDKFSKLKTLNLAGNNFSYIPASIGNLTELTTLHVYMNQFNTSDSIPAEIGNLSNLEYLWLSWLPDMAPWEIPFGFSKFKKMKIFKIRLSNLVGEIPESVGEMEALEFLDLADNKLSGKVPSSVFLLKNLSVIYLFKNRLSGEIPQVVEAHDLSIIDISENNLTGKMPQAFGGLTKLKEFSLFENDISGEIPEGMGSLPHLVIFKMFNMNLSGTIPQELGMHSPLEDFQVSVNRLTGKLPDGLCKNGKLVSAVAYRNSLTGELPSSLGNCDTLLVVSVYNNMLSGDIPSGMWNASSLGYALMSNNYFTGELPEKMSSNLQMLQIGNNKFSGQIKGVSSCKDLHVFEAGNNLFDGSIPQELTALPNLTTLVLHQNRLSGPLPSEIVSWKSLNTLDLSSNQLSGPIPEGLGVLPVLTELDLSENQLQGQIPSQLGQLRFNQLNLSSNLLTGEIPSSLVNSAYDTSFLNNTNLCAKTSGVNLNICSKSPKSSDFSKLSPRSLALILSLSTALFLMVVFLLVFFVKGYLRKDGSDADWKLVAYQRLNFTTSKILSGLMESNVIGSGGSGKVYRVPVNRTGDVVAVKRIWTNKKIMEPRLEKEFLAEIKILSSIRHANIVKLICCISSETSKLLVYEYSDNRSLDRWLNKKNRPALSNLSSSVHHVVLDWPKRLQIALGAAKGLCYMHHDCVPPIVHRDVKSSNILLDSDFSAKIADFGLAKMLVKQGDLATMSVVAGSFGYMAPEYGHTTRVNEKIDVYSFGVVLLELATGREPNEGDEDTSLAEWAWRHAQKGKPTVDALDEDVKEPCYLEEMCAVFRLGIKCTETLPSNRPTMKEVLHILVRICPAPVRREKTEFAAAPLLKNSRRERALEEQEGLATNV